MDTAEQIRNNEWLKICIQDIDEQIHELYTDTIQRYPLPRKEVLKELKAKRRILVRRIKMPIVIKCAYHELFNIEYHLTPEINCKACNAIKREAELKASGYKVIMSLKDKFLVEINNQREWICHQNI